MDLLERVKKLCSEKKISQRKLEAELELSNGSVSKWNKSSPSGDVLQKVADYFNVSVDYLLGREEVELPDVYLRLAREAQNLGLDNDDIDAILNLYKYHKEKNK